jgi:hypothetical protein
MSTSFITAGHVRAFQAMTMQLYGEVTLARCRIKGAPGVAIVLVEHCRRREDWRHSKFAAQRFAHEAAPALTSFADSSPPPFIAGIKSARERIVARSDEDRESLFRKRGFSKSETAKIVETVLHEEGCPPESLFDFAQGITALARGKAHQDARLELKGRAKRLLERA